MRQSERDSKCCCRHEEGNWWLGKAGVKGVGDSEIRQQRELQNAKRGKTLTVSLTVNRDEQLCDFHGQGAWRENIVIARRNTKEMHRNLRERKL